MLHNQLLQEKIYTNQEIGKAALIIHPKNIEKYELKAEEIAMIFEEWSNFTHLQNPIIDEYGNEYRDSEWFYMAQRIEDSEIKRMIAFCSIGHGLSKKAAYKYKEYMNTNTIDRIEYMRNAIKEKFDKNPKLKELLLSTKNREIIEYTYRWDKFFWISHETKSWSNILGKLLMEYRDKENKK
jgi:ribA/ribD-fused uncharacterized protein